MRMWNVEPAVMCRKHLLGEHLEMHMFYGAAYKNKNLRGYVEKGLVELHHIKIRHDELAEEMVRRGYKHNSEIEHEAYTKIEGWDYGFVDPQRSLEELAWRCPECQVRIKEFYSGE